MKKQLLLIGLGLLGLGFAYAILSQAKANPCGPLICISKTVEHEAINQTVQGIVDALAQAGLVSGENCSIVIESAQANVNLAYQIAAKFMGQSPDVVVGVGTLAAQSFCSYALKQNQKSKLTTFLFSSVTDPESAGLLAGNLFKGVSNFVALEPQIKLFKKLQPNLRKLGILYNSAELNSIKIVQGLKDSLQLLDLQLVEQTITKTSDIAQAATVLAQQVDAIFVSNDNTVLSGLANVIAIANKNQVPVYVSDTDTVPLGALAAMGPNQYELGQQTGQLIVQAIKIGQATLPQVSYPQIVETHLSQKVARQLNLEINPELMASANQVWQ